MIENWIRLGFKLGDKTKLVWDQVRVLGLSISYLFCNKLKKSTHSYHYHLDVTYNYLSKLAI